MMTDELLRAVLRHLLSAEEAQDGRFQQSDMQDAIKRAYKTDDGWLTRAEWLEGAGYVEQHTTIWYVLTDEGRRLAGG